MSSTKSITWLGDPDVSVMSEDGHMVMTHRSVLGMYSTSFRHLLSINPADREQCIIICHDIDSMYLKEMIRNAQLNFQTFIYEHEDNHSEDVEELQTKLISTVSSINVNEENKGLTDSQFKKKNVMKLIGTMPKELQIEIVKMESEHSQESESSSTKPCASSILSDGVADADRTESSIQEGKNHTSKSVQGNVTTHANKKHLGNPKTYLCDQCDFKARDSTVLKRHQRAVHEGIKLPCNFCEFKASYESSIRNHIRYVHEGVRRVQCPHCGKQFVRDRNLKEHIQSFHEGRKYKCQFCEYHATQKRNLLVHFVKIHKDMDVKIFKERMREFRYTRNQGTIINSPHE